MVDVKTVARHMLICSPRSYICLLVTYYTVSQLSKNGLARKSLGIITLRVRSRQKLWEACFSRNGSHIFRSLGHYHFERGDILQGCYIFQSALRECNLKNMCSVCRTPSSSIFKRASPLFIHSNNVNIPVFEI